MLRQGQTQQLHLRAVSIRQHTSHTSHTALYYCAILLATEVLVAELLRGGGHPQQLHTRACPSAHTSSLRPHTLVAQGPPQQLHTRACPSVFSFGALQRFLQLPRVCCHNKGVLQGGYTGWGCLKSRIKQVFQGFQRSPGDAREKGNMGCLHTRTARSARSYAEDY